MARRALLVTVLCGCNAIYGNDRAIARDAQYFDAPFDAPFACPTPGTTPPAFSPELHPVMLQNCLDYSFQGERASAICRHTTGELEVFEGPREGPLVVVASALENPLDSGRDQPRLSSDGSKLYFRRVDFVSSQEVRIGHRQADDTFVISGVAAFGGNLNDSISTIGRGPDGDHVLVRASDGSLHEWAEHAGVWVPTRDHSDLGIEFGQVKLSQDALHLVGITMKGIYYSDRATVDAPFGVAMKLDNAPVDLTAPLLTDNCARLYVSGVGEVFYAQQR